MAYQVLARKWRPQDFSGLVGQEHVVTALRNGLNEGRIAQAYLFSGIRGVGKTTAARVFAKALNCERGPVEGPCNECPSCLEINAGTSLDFLEVDAATYSKVEQVRELTETLRYGPARSPYKVVVLDEVHRLSRQAFDALLKIVEEPPAHLVFIFATTEIDSVPATILSRCQEFQFRRVPSPVLAAHLREICGAEDIEASDAALRLVARAGEGSVRDSVALLDQMATFGSGTVSDEEASRLLGGLDSAIFQRLLVAVLDGEHAPILEVIADIEANGWDPHNVFAQFVTYVRDALHLAMGGRDDAVDLPAEEAETLAELVRGRGYEPLLQVLHLLLDSEPAVRRSELGVLALEVAWLRAAELPKVVRLQDVLSGSAPASPPAGSGGDAGGGGGGSGGSGTGGPTREVRNPRPEPPARRVRGPGPETATAEPPAGDPEAGEELLPQFLEVLKSHRQFLAAHLQQARLTFRDRTLLVQPQPGDTLLTSALDRERNGEALRRALEQTWGAGVTWRLEAAAAGDDATATGQPGLEPDNGESRGHLPRNGTPRNGTSRNGGFVPEPPAAAAAPSSRRPDADAGVRGPSAEDLQQAARQPTVRSVLDIFGGKIQSVQDENEEKAP